MYKILITTSFFVPRMEGGLSVHTVVVEFPSKQSAIEAVASVTRQPSSELTGVRREAMTLF